MGHALHGRCEQEGLDMDIKFDDAVKAAEQAKDVKPLTLEEAIKAMKAGA